MRPEIQHSGAHVRWDRPVFLLLQQHGGWQDTGGILCSMREAGLHRRQVQGMLSIKFSAGLAWEQQWCGDGRVLHSTHDEEGTVNVHTMQLDRG